MKSTLLLRLVSFLLIAAAAAPAQVPSCPANGHGIIGTVIDPHWTGGVLYSAPQFIGSGSCVAATDGSASLAYCIAGGTLPGGSIGIQGSVSASFYRTGGPGAVSLQSILCVASLAAAAANPPDGQASGSGSGVATHSTSLLPGLQSIGVSSSASAMATEIPVFNLDRDDSNLTITVSTLQATYFSVRHTTSASACAYQTNGYAIGAGGALIESLFQLH